MVSIQTRGHVGSDGTLALQERTPLRNVDVDVLVVLQPMAPADAAPEDRGWPAGKRRRQDGRGDCGQQAAPYEKAHRLGKGEVS